MQVWKGNDVRHLGYFDDEEAAAKAYDRAVIQLRGPAAPTNFDPTDLLSEVAAAGELADGIAEATQEEVDRVDSFFLASFIISFPVLLQRTCLYRSACLCHSLAQRMSADVAANLHAQCLSGNINCARKLL